MRRGRLALLVALALSLPLLVVGLGAERLARDQGAALDAEARSLSAGQRLVLGSSALLFLIGLGVGGAGLVRVRGKDDDDASAPRDIEREVREVAAQLSRGDFDVRLRVGADATQDAFNRMTQELERARARAVKAERVAAWRDIARRIAHEIKNPLTPIRMAIETMRKTFARKHPDFPEIFEESTLAVLEEVARMETIVTEFSRFARLPRPRAELASLLEVVRHVVSMHDLAGAAVSHPGASGAPRVTLEVDAGGPREDTQLLLRFDREQITQVLVNLLQNALDAAREAHPEGGGEVLVRVRQEEPGSAIVEIHDDGAGVAEEERAHVFEPYVTGKSHGTGLGLPICDRIVSDHGGAISVDTSPRLGGALFVLTLRREGPPDEAAASQQS